MIGPLAATLLLASAVASSDSSYQALLEQVREEQGVPGISVVVTRGNRIVFSGASGYADIETRRAMTADTVLYCGSLSKVLTATLVLKLVEDRALALGANASDILDTPIAGARPITVEHLLTHTSGLTREGDFGYWFHAEFPSQTDLRSYLRTTSLRAPPGERQHYSNIGYATLGLVAATVESESYGKVLQSRVLQPLHMTATRTGGPADTISRGYTPIGRLIPSEEKPFAGVGQRVGARHLREYHHADAMTPAFGIQSTALDLSKLTRFLLGHGNDAVLSMTLREKMLTRQAASRSYGLGIHEIDGTSIARHGGWFAGHRSHILIDAENDISVVVMANSDSASPDVTAERLYELTVEEQQ